MKLLQFGITALLAVSFNVNGQKLNSTCNDGHLVIDIPYPNKETAKLLHLEAGNCTKSDDGVLEYNTTTSVARVKVPIAKCDLQGELYDKPVTTRSLYRPTAKVTFGDRLQNMDIIYRHMDIAAECGKRTSYTVEFNYTDIGTSDTEDCHDNINGTCIFPAYEDDVELAINEYTDSDYNIKVETPENRAKLAGKSIYLSMRATTITDGYKFAVTNCTIIGQDNSTFILMEPGHSSAPTCSMKEVELKASYDNNHNFNFQHVLFLMNSVADSRFSSFKLKCTAEICDKKVADSKCNKAVVPCMDTDDKKEKYMCAGFCAADQRCVVRNNVPECSVP